MAWTMLKKAVLTGLTALALFGLQTEEPLAAQETSDEITKSIGLLKCQSGLMRWSSIATLTVDRQTIVGVGHFAAIDGGRESSAVRSGKCNFVLYDRSGNIAFKSAVLLTAQGGSALDRRFSRATDWAVFHLTNPAPTTFRPVPLGRLERAERKLPVRIFGMGRHGGERRLLRRSCTPSGEATGSALLLYDCATGGGWSGAPILQPHEGQLQIVGLHSGRESAHGVAVIFNEPIRKKVLENSWYLARTHRPGPAAARQ